MREHSTVAKPETLGLSAFAISQVLLNLPNAHLVPDAAVELSLPTILVTGGMVQLLCCVLEYVRGNDFGTTAFGIYGSFFLSLGALGLLQTLGILHFGPNAGAAVGTFLAVWTVFTAGMTAIAFRREPMLGVMFMLIFTAFLGGALHHLAGFNSAYGGWSGILSAMVGAYLGFRNLWQDSTANSDLAVREEPAPATVAPARSAAS
jgi:succinate-acetate transporter protein